MALSTDDLVEINALYARYNASIDTGGAKNRFGPTNEKGEALLLHTGSVSTRYPSISIRTLE